MRCDESHGRDGRVYYDKGMDTLDIWFSDPPEEGFSREISDGIIINIILNQEWLESRYCFYQDRKQ